MCDLGLICGSTAVNLFLIQNKGDVLSERAEDFTSALDRRHPSALTQLTDLENDNGLK